MTDYYKTLEVDRTASADEIRKAYRRLAKLYHPDIRPGHEIKFGAIAEAYKILSDPNKRQHYDAGGGLMKPITLKTKGGSFRIEELVTAGDIANIYRGVRTDLSGEIPAAFKIAKNPRDNDLLENEAEVLKTLFPIADEETGKRRYLPKFWESLKLDIGGTRCQTNIFPWLTNFYTLAEVRKAFEAKLQMEHGVWMFNRILEGLDFIHKKGYVHGALVPSHVLVFSSGQEKHPYNHGAKIIDWSYAQKIGGQIKAIAPEWAEFYPPEILHKKDTSPSTDIYMAAKCIMYVLGGDVSNDSMPSHIPPYLSRFLKGCVLKSPQHRPADAWDLHEELSAHLRTHYGPKKYVRFDMPD